MIYNNLIVVSGALMVQWHGLSKYAKIEGREWGWVCGGKGEVRLTRMKYCCDGGKGSWWIMNKQEIYFWVIFYPIKAQEAQEMHICLQVRGFQNSNVNVVGWNNICHRARLHFCKLVRHMWLIGFTLCNGLSNNFDKYCKLSENSFCRVKFLSF